MAPRSHVWNGIWADFTIPAIHSNATGRRMYLSAVSDIRRASSSNNPHWSASMMLAARNAIPPMRLSINCLNELLTASSVFVNPMSAKEHRVVISQKKNIHVRLLERTIPNMALRNTNIRKKNHGLRSFSSL